jgi:hypothetical protein
VQRWILAPGVAEQYFLPGTDPNPFVDHLVIDEPRARLWTPFEKHLTELLHGSLPHGLSSWLLAEPEPVGPDMVVLPLVESPRDGVTGEWLPLLLRDSPSRGWRLLNFSRTPPRPGWPPIF